MLCILYFIIYVNHFGMKKKSFLYKIQADWYSMNSNLILTNEIIEIFLMIISKDVCGLFFLF